MPDIAAELGVSRGSVSLWTRDVVVEMGPRRVRETRLKLRVFLHEGLDLEAANAHWGRVTGIPTAQFHKPYRAVADGSIRQNKHEFGCVTVRYSCSRTHRSVMGLCRALLSSAS